MGSEGSIDGVASDAAASIPRPGEVIGGKFVVERVLGVGGMGVVVAAHHSHLEQTVAIKFLRRDAAKDEAAVNRFLREARAVAALQSDHVVRVMDAGRLEDGLPYLVMEYLSGVDLDQVLVQRGRLPLDECIEYLLQTMEAVAEAHAAGIVHRDLKPSNLFLATRPDGTRIVKVLDFGISKALDVMGRQQVSLTATSMTLGSPLYMSPEQVRSSKSVDLRTDIWALGIIAYELLAGIQPFEADTVTGLCAKIVADEPEPLRTVRPDVPVEFEAVVMRCLQKSVAARYQSVGELAIALRPFASSDGHVSVNRIARLSGGFLRPAVAPTLASAQDGRGSSPGSPGLPVSATPMPTPNPGAVSGPDAAAGYAETVASWQTTGTRRGRRAIVTTGGVAVAIAIALLLVARWPKSSSQPSTAPSMAAGIAVDVVATGVKTELAPAPPVASAPDTATPVASAPDTAAPVALASAVVPAPALVSAPVGANAPAHAAAAAPKHALAPAIKAPALASAPAKAPAPRSPDDLLLDRK